MSTLSVIAAIVTLTAVLSYVNHQFIGLPSSVALMLMTLAASVIVIVLSVTTSFGAEIRSVAEGVIESIHFQEALLQVMLGFLLFAGALKIDLSGLMSQKWLVTTLATVGVLMSTAIVGVLTWLLLRFLGTAIPLAYCLVFGALISPTDPIAVLRTLKRLGVAREVDMAIAGESLFNDGVGVVIYSVILEIAVSGGGGAGVDVTDALLLFLKEAGGGILFGLVSGYITYLLLRSVNQYHVEILLTVALVAGGFIFANSVGISGPLAMVVAGLLIGNPGKEMAMSRETVANLDIFWELIDEFLTGFLFVLIGLEALVLSLKVPIIGEALLVAPIVVLARLFSVGLPTSIFVRQGLLEKKHVAIMIWSGLKGGISVAMALALPTGPHREVILIITYVVVVFSIVVQGLSIGPFVKKLSRPAES